jgi:hypothetical protein
MDICKFHLYLCLRRVTFQVFSLLKHEIFTANSWKNCVLARTGTALVEVCMGVRVHVFVSTGACVCVCVCTRICWELQLL